MQNDPFFESGPHQKCPDCRLYKNQAGLCQCTSPQNPFYFGANNHTGDPRPRSLKNEEKSALECQDCGKLCFHDRRRGTPPPTTGYGWCIPCGGQDIINRSRELERHRALYGGTSIPNGD